MMEPNLNLIGFRLADALEWCGQHNIKTKINSTRPSKGNPEGTLRVINYSAVMGTAFLTVAHEENPKGGVLSGL